MVDMTRIVELYVPKTMVGINASTQIGIIAAQYNAKKALLISDQGILQAGLLNGISESLHNINIITEVFTNCPASAPISSIVECSKIILEQTPNIVVGIGGGSVLDLTKLAVALADHNGDLDILYNPNKIKRRSLPVALIPTTAGTGSEVSSGAVFTDEALGRKKGVKSSNIYADVAILDPNLTLNLPPRITADTGMDVLSHAIEAYTSTKANTISDALAEKSIKLVAENLRLAYTRGSKLIEVRYNMMVAASLSIISLNSSASYIVHSFSYPLGMKTYLSHGAACALMLPYVMEYNLIGNSERFARVADLMGESTRGLTVDERARRSVSQVKNLITDIGLPSRLTEVGISKSDIPEMVDYVIKNHGYQIATNPRAVDRDSLIGIMESAL